MLIYSFLLSDTSFLKNGRVPKSFFHGYFEKKIVFLGKNC